MGRVEGRGSSVNSAELNISAVKDKRGVEIESRVAAQMHETD
jgi:hypothetical protein